MIEFESLVFIFSVLLGTNWPNVYTTTLSYGCPLPNRTFVSPKKDPTLHPPLVAILLTQQYRPSVSPSLY